MKMQIEPTTPLSCPHPNCNASFTLIEALGKEEWKELVKAASIDEKEERFEIEQHVRTLIEEEQKAFIRNTLLGWMRNDVGEK